MPVDLEPAPDGNLLLDIDSDATVRATYIRDDSGPLDNGRPRYVSHFATCPHAHTHRNR